MYDNIRVCDVEKYYGNDSNVTKAIDRVSFTVERGEFVGVMGASGSGKTTLLNMLATIDRVTSGHIFYGDTDITELKDEKLSDFRKENLGFVFQDYNLLDTLTMEENIVLALTIRKEGKAEIQRKCGEIMRILGIEEIKNKFPYQVSGGQKQRCACARALVNRPRLLLADEPTGALDSQNSKMLMETFVLMNQSAGSTILMVTHDPVVGAYADRVLFLKDGKIFSEADRGTRSRREMYREILSVTAAGGGADVF